MMDVMKAVAEVEKGQGGENLSPRRVPSPRVMDKPTNYKKPGKNVSELEEDLFRNISNPGKMCTSPIKRKPKKKKKKTRSLSSFGSSVSSIDVGSDIDSFGSMDDRSEFSGSSDRSYTGREEFTRKQRKEEIMQEKIEMLTRISKMSKQGFTATKKWTLKDNIDEIRFECYRMTRESNSKKSVKSMQHILITIATIVEFANNVVNPFNLKLQGFSKNMMLTVSDYDDSLEELHHKWSGRTSIGPEMTILFTFVTSAVFHHAGNVMNTPADDTQPTSRTSNTAKTKMPDMSSVLGMFSNIMPTKPKPDPANDKESPDTIRKTRKPMKGPSVGILPSMTIP